MKRRKELKKSWGILRLSHDAVHCLGLRGLAPRSEVPKNKNSLLDGLNIQKRGIVCQKKTQLNMGALWKSDWQETVSVGICKEQSGPTRPS